MARTKGITSAMGAVVSTARAWRPAGARCPSAGSESAATPLPAAPGGSAGKYWSGPDFLRLFCSVEADAPDKFCSGKLAGEHQALAGPQVRAVEVDVPAAADAPLVLVVEPQAPAWAQQIVHFLQTGELPEEQEEAERVARQSSMYQFVERHCTEEGSMV